MAKRQSSVNPRHLNPSDLRAAAQLAAAATVGVTRIIEAVHQSVLATLRVRGSAAPGRTGGLTGLIYRGIAGTTHVLGRGAELALTRLEPMLQAALVDRPGTPQREAVLAALNGVMGDRLITMGNPLAAAMTLRLDGVELDLSQPLGSARPRIVLLVHGLCMNDLQWRTAHAGEVVDHGQMLAGALDATPLYLRYNTGQHISLNGQLLANQLKQLMSRWPGGVPELTVVAHSMGGLVIRSALHHARARGQRWPQRLKSVVFLGTPHHGAPLERAGNWIDLLLGSNRWSAPFHRLTQLRSAGITDLRYGFVTDDDWQGKERFRRAPDQRLVVPLPAHVACYAIAATTAGQRSLLADRLVGDGLVPLHSALGQHANAERTLRFAKAAQHILYRTNHMQLLSSPAVGAQLLAWLRPGSASAPARS